MQTSQLISELLFDALWCEWNHQVVLLLLSHWCCEQKFGLNVAPHITWHIWWLCSTGHYQDIWTVQSVLCSYIKDNSLIQLELRSFRQNKSIRPNCGSAPLLSLPFYWQFTGILELFPVIKPTCVRLQGKPRGWRLWLVGCFILKEAKSKTDKQQLQQQQEKLQQQEQQQQEKQHQQQQQEKQQEQQLQEQQQQEQQHPQQQQQQQQQFQQHQQQWQQHKQRSTAECKDCPQRWSQQSSECHQITQKYYLSPRRTTFSGWKQSWIRPGECVLEGSNWNYSCIVSLPVIIQIGHREENKPVKVSFGSSGHDFLCLLTTRTSSQESLWAAAMLVVPHSWTDDVQELSSSSPFPGWRALIEKHVHSCRCNLQTCSSNSRSANVYSKVNLNTLFSNISALNKVKLLKVTVQSMSLGTHVLDSVTDEFPWQQFNFA